MTDAPLRTIASVDGDKYDKSISIVNGYSDYGLQMTVYRGELYGIMTQTVQYPKQLFATKFHNGGWKSFRSLPSKMLSQGRVSVTVLDDVFYVLRRGTNNANYLLSTTDFSKFNDIGRIGSKYAETHVAPAITAYGGKLFMAGVGKDKYIYFTIADKTGKRLISWTKIPATGTQSALAMAVLGGKLHLFHTGYNNDKIFVQTYNDNGSWSKLSFFKTNITSGVSATSWKLNQIVLSFKGKDEDIKTVTFDGAKFGAKKYVPNVYMRYQTGLATFDSKLVISYAAKKGTKSLDMGYMSEKGMMEEIEEVDEDREWECKWNEGESSKTWIRKALCM